MIPRLAIRDFASAIEDSAASVFVGAGLSKAAGYPTWAELLVDIASELELPIDRVHDLSALAQWSITEEGGASKVLSVIRKEIGPTRPIPESIKTLARLPIRNIWTTNYDRLIERAFEEIERPLDVISQGPDLTVRGISGAAKLLKMHGTVDMPSQIVISTDDYELYKKDRAGFLTLLEANLTTTSMLFAGLSFADPNLKHVLGAIRESFHDVPPEHFALVKRPQEAEFHDSEEYNFRLRQHNLWSRDLRRYGLKSIELDSFDEIPQYLSDLEKLVSLNTVWINGAYPIDDGQKTEEVFNLSSRLGRLIATKGKKLLSGSGLTVGAGSISGFVSALDTRYSWNINERLVVRAFPQYYSGGEASLTDYWSSIREDLARTSGISIFVSGEKNQSGKRYVSDGVLDEFDKALKAGNFLIPIGSSGGAARKIAERLLESPVEARGVNAQRPTDEELRALYAKDADVITLVDTILDRVWSSNP